MGAPKTTPGSQRYDETLFVSAFSDIGGSDPFPFAVLPFSCCIATLPFCGWACVTSTSGTPWRSPAAVGEWESLSVLPLYVGVQSR